MSKSYDLSTSTKWANLADGEHVVKLRARGAGYGSSSFSNSVTVAKGNAMPVKGDLITIESKQYRVLKTNGSVAEVLAMYNSTDSQKFNVTASTNTYENSSLDVYLSQTFYNSLSSDVRNAIISKTLQQDSWRFSWNVGTIEGTSKYIGRANDGDDYETSLGSLTYGNSIVRNCYVLSVQDVIDYLDVSYTMTASDTTLNPTNVFLMFWNQVTSPGSTSCWLCSAIFDNPANVFIVTGDYGSLSYNSPSYGYSVRPAFQIDLSKIEWSPVGGGN